MSCALFCRWQLLHDIYLPFFFNPFVRRLLLFSGKLFPSLAPSHQKRILRGSAISAANKPRGINQNNFAASCSGRPHTHNLPSHKIYRLIIKSFFARSQPMRKQKQNATINLVSIQMGDKTAPAMETIWRKFRHAWHRTLPMSGGNY